MTAVPSQDALNRAAAAAAQRAAADPAVSAWVGASAGTGKTTVLTNRILRLLLAGAAPERLLCLTFTKAAAAVMAIRLHRVLGRWATTDEAALGEELHRLEGQVADEKRRDAARRLFARVLDTPGGMRIQTIHSFCQSLLSRFPIEAGVPPHFDIADDNTAAELLQAALNATLAAAAADQALGAAVAEVARHVREDAFLDLLRQLLGRRGRLARMRDQAGGLEPLLNRIAAALGVDPEATEASVLASGCGPGSCDEASLRMAARGLAAGTEKEAERAGIILEWLDRPAARVEAMAAYRRAFLTKEGTVLARLVNKGTAAAYPAAETTLRDEAHRLLALQEQARAAAVRAATAALLRLGQAILVRYEQAKAARALLDYKDLILRTRALFDLPGIAPWVLYKLDGGIDHVLVDEAQDTSPDQWAVVAALAEEFFAGRSARETDRTLFAVGDVKQSIYSFQGADPDAFRRMRAHFQARAEAVDAVWRPVELMVSFRSTEAILTAVDTVFAGVEAKDGLADTGRGDPAVIEHLVSRLGQTGRVEVWPLLAPAAAEEEAPWSPPVDQRFAVSPIARLARRIARMVRRWLDEGTILESAGRPIRPGDVLVLLRRRTAFAAQMVRAFKDAGVPVAGIDRMVLPQQMAVMDLAALGRFVLLPEDDLNLATLLKSPLVGLDEDDLFQLATGRVTQPLWSALARRRGEPRFAAAHAFLADRLRRADFVTPFAFFAETLGPGGGRTRLLDRLGPDAADPIDEFLSQTLVYERSHAPSLQGFLHWLDIQATEVRREVEAGTDAVRVMTVHGAKGLEAPIVFLPDTAQVPRDTSPLLWGEGPGDAGSGSELVLWPVRRDNEESLCRGLREAAQRRGMQEYRRLLYVAMTRAEDRLYVCGWRGTREPPAGNWHALVDQAMRAGALGEELPDPTSTDPDDQDATIWRFEVEGDQVRAGASHRAPSAAAADPPWLFHPPPPEPSPSRPLAPSRPTEEEPAPRSPVGNDDGQRFRRGLLLHRLLQSLPDLPAGERAAASERFLAQPSHRLDPATRAAWTREVLAVLDDPAAAALFDAPGQAEVPIVGRVGAAAISGTIDRLVVTDEAVVILDYKTNRPPPAVEADTPPLYLRQMAAYRTAVAAIYPDRPIRCAILWTDGPNLMWLSEAALDGAITVAGPP
ncbi:DNA helicase/exodeoxyribonuclease V subunit A [Stella humosa]|uniref:DNA 3'-5' helicase n=1 Tax=Stella humosa TaxID=94 RepID=A0A3N1LIK8_9PROT|nr:double-strand break repair helicase AddA [Stella humosa]ROP90679.1 DNA helicase/exodeoxyribonuclease V subunit A [Stella humosa]